jgi:hypothetical protein
VYTEYSLDGALVMYETSENVFLAMSKIKSDKKKKRYSWLLVNFTNFVRIETDCRKMECEV